MFCISTTHTGTCEPGLLHDCRLAVSGSFQLMIVHALVRKLHLYPRLLMGNKALFCYRSPVALGQL
jgi:hypothetical protein